MARLSVEDRRKRLLFDYRIVARMNGQVMQMSAYRNTEDLKAGNNPISSESDGHLATHYLVTYYIKTLVGPDKYCEHVQVHFDLLCNGNYPFSEPGCWVVSALLPWSPHFKLGHPICIGEIWEDSKGKMLLGQLLIHIARLLNFDEISRDGGYVGWNSEAIEYWRTLLKEKPINPTLLYPILPTDITHGVISTLQVQEDLFTAVKKEDPNKSPSLVFQAKSRPQENFSFTPKKK
ncbi:MAG: hypothetical protein HYR87_01970 [Thaumarchaeota archaeon]|nr:hypothetical protein [Nitrososphaerota archaeon]